MKDPKAMYALSYGLFILTARQGDRDNGCVINTAMQVTDDPRQLSVAVNKGNYTHDMVLETGKLALSVLSEQAGFPLFQRFGFQSGREGDKFRDFIGHTIRGEDGLLRVTRGTCAWLSCTVAATMDLGTHTLFLARVEDGDRLSDSPAATYAYYQAHIKPQPQPPAGGTQKRWVCTVCGYVYEGDLLPQDYICPLCKHPAADFALMKN